MNITQSMGSVGDAYDNAIAESFFTSLECELIKQRSFKTRAQAQSAVFSWIEGWYNPRRLHSALHYQSPNQLERSMYQNTKKNYKPKPNMELPTVCYAVMDKSMTCPQPSPVHNTT
jgi:transposase InsO family protein